MVAVHGFFYCRVYFRQVQQMIEQVAEFRFGQFFQLGYAVFDESHP